MMRLHLALLLGCCAALDAVADEVSFARDVVPLFKSRCVVCHMPGSALGGLSLHPRGGYALMVGIKSVQSPQMLVAPGSPDSSYLYRKLLGTQAAAGGAGERMPMEALLNDAQLDLIRRWIEQGAKDN